MPNIMDYLIWRGDLSLKSVPFCDVDSLILSLLSYLDWDEIVPPCESDAAITLEAAAERYFATTDGRTGHTGVLVPLQTEDLLKAAAQAPRFAQMQLCRYTDRIETEREVQFSALTFLLEDKTLYVAYRGTDDTLVGWKEDFNMSFLVAIPSQQMAAAYLHDTAAALRGKLRLGGHSKGGNLAVYAAAFAKKRVQNRILQIYNNDGPGFGPQVIHTEGYNSICSNVRTIVPQSSVFGMLLEHEEPYTVVHSTQVGLFQHDAFSWQVVGNHFEQLDQVDETSRLIDATLKEWISGMDRTQKEQFADALYEALTVSGAKTLTDLTKNAGTAIRAFAHLDEETKKCITATLAALAKTGLQMGYHTVSQNITHLVRLPT